MVATCWALSLGAQANSAEPAAIASSAANGSRRCRVAEPPSTTSAALRHPKGGVNRRPAAGHDVGQSPEVVLVLIPQVRETWHPLAWVLGPEPHPGTWVKVALAVLPSGSVMLTV